MKRLDFVDRLTLVIIAVIFFSALVVKPWQRSAGPYHVAVSGRTAEHYPSESEDRLGYFFWEMGRVVTSGEIIPILLVNIAIPLGVRAVRWMTGNPARNW